MIFFKTTGLAVSVVYYSFYGGYLNVGVNLPKSFRNERIIGLLGSPDDDSMNDWTNSTGFVLPFPANRHSQEAYDYCMTHWCIRDSAESIFVYDGPYNFSFYSGCDDPYQGDVNLDDASPGVQELCGLNKACLIDGIVLGLDAAQVALTEQAASASASAFARFRFAPAVIQVNLSYNVVVMVNLIDDTNFLSNIEAFAVYRIDPNTLQVGSAPVVSLQSNGAGIFSNIISVRSTVSGETFAFRAVPIIGGVEDSNSELVFTSLSAVQSYSSQSGIGELPADSPTDQTIYYFIQGRCNSYLYTGPESGLETDFEAFWNKNPNCPDAGLFCGSIDADVDMDANTICYTWASCGPTRCFSYQIVGLV